MGTNVRTFLRDFAAFKARTRKGETVRVQDREGEFLFAAAAPRRRQGEHRYPRRPDQTHVVGQ